jgi:hypothetical protein
VVTHYRHKDRWRDGDKELEAAAPVSAIIGNYRAQQKSGTPQRAAQVRSFIPNIKNDQLAATSSRNNLHLPA